MIGIDDHEEGTIVVLSKTGVDYFNRHFCAEYIEDYLQPREVTVSAYNKNVKQVRLNEHTWFHARKIHFDVFLEFESEWI